MAAAVDIITLDNFQSKLPKWDVKASNNLYALVDMGSNGIRFSITDLSGPQARLLKSVYKERAGISLFDALSDASSEGGPLVFPVETITRVSQTLARFHSIAVDHYGVPEAHIIVFATEAMRRAQNASAMLDAIRTEARLCVQILAPEVETLFGSVGARSSFRHVKGLFLDLGGGSVQMTYMDTHEAVATERTPEERHDYEVAAAKAGQSLPFGAARLIRVLEGADVDVRTSEMSKLQAGMRQAFENLRQTFQSLADTVSQIQRGEDGAGLEIYLCGGGFRGYGSMLMHCDPVQPYPISFVGSYTVSGERFCETKAMMHVNQTYDGKIFGMSKRRRAQFPAIVTVVEALIAAVPKIRRVTFCSGGNREGALMMRLPKEVRDCDPVIALSDIDGDQSSTSTAVVELIKAALPSQATLTLFDLGLGRLFVQQMWQSMGYDREANASAALHSALKNHPDCPGLTHVARALIALTLCARWGGSLGPVDQQLRRNLQLLVDSVDKEAVFWTEYIGAVAAVFTTIVPTYRRLGKVNQLRENPDNIKFQATIDSNGKTTKISTTLSVPSNTLKGIELGDLEESFKDAGSNTKYSSDKKWKVKLQIQEVSSL